jgi:uncharacterized peroxidase-related enzyme
MDHHAAEVAALCDAVLNSVGAVDPDVRGAAFRGDHTPKPWTGLVAQVREESYKVTDSDIEDLLASGFTEDEVFEITVAAALGAAKRRLDAGLRAIEAGPDVRLPILDHGHRLRQSLALKVLRLVGQTEPDPVAKLSLYRPDFFGRHWMHFIESVMRGPSEWSEGERELMGAFVSRLNTCRFCVGIHQGITTLLIGAEYVERLDDWSEAELDPRIKATFHLLEKLTSTPEDVAAPDIARVRAAGLSDDAITDAIYVSFLFATINRIANALDFDWETDADRLKLAAGLNRIRYHVPELLLH